SLHGTVFDFMRNDAFDAHHPGSTGQNPELRQNQFGYVLGGPIYIPKVYDGRNKTFFLANYEGQRTIRGITGQVPTFLPTQAMLAGDFSNATILNGPNVGQPLPAFGTTLCDTERSAGRLCMPIDPLTGSPFPGNIIPSARFSRLAKLTKGLYPVANLPGNQFVLTNALPNNVDQQTYKGDQTLGKWGQVF